MQKPFFSIKWKISISFVVFVLIFVGIYIFLAKNTFESDKIGYVYEVQQRQVDAAAERIDQQIERALFDAKTIVSSYEESKNQQLAERLLAESADLVFIQVRRASSGEALLNIGKQPAKDLNQIALTRNFRVVPWDDNSYVLHVPSTNAKQEDLRLLIVTKLNMMDEKILEGQSIVVLANAQPVRSKIASPWKQQNFENFVSSLVNKNGESLVVGTTLKSFDGNRYLVSYSQARGATLSVFVITSEGYILGALKSLFQRSMIFLFFSFLAAIVLSLLVSSRLTRNLAVLSLAAEKIGQGDLSVRLNVDSSDEIGALARTFEKMAEQIKNLLGAVGEKVRMEAELKTARLVQESLFPHASSYEAGRISLAGHSLTSTECGGDWWFFYQQGDELYVFIADATGHGTSAALITAVSRSIFSYIEKNSLQLWQIAQLWDEAVRSTSQQKVFMTAFLMQINVNTGVGSYLNAGHEFPLIFKKDGAEFLMGIQNQVLGELSRKEWAQSSFTLGRGEKMLLYTDGVTSVQNAQGKTLGEKRLIRELQKFVSAGSLEQSLSEIDGYLQSYNDGDRLPDDITLVLIEKR